ncbi:MAG: GspE/PulE family protein [Bacteroidetes bacterium]|nr:GspE/PulE family protein [Rhodothermia bacterium]MCS7155222.1 GspE/PulE family protein [Bacteroidota bacterium]MCX7907807.1 GspE/PulE family protein [Bacteroidota bacterium]MDW8138626.1 GspE/PulE family protein [Bacteroidota bacterium]MDW8284788.1 GspE/PulE family protein [Bacteroidota bacterium]
MEARTRQHHTIGGNGEAESARLPIQDRVVASLLAQGYISVEHIRKALEIQRRERGERRALWRILMEDLNADPDLVLDEAARIYAFRQAHVEESRVDPTFIRQVLDSFPKPLREELLALKVLPLAYEVEQQGYLRLIFVTPDPAHPRLMRLLRELSLERYEVRYAPRKVVSDLLALVSPSKNEYLERIREQGIPYDLGATYAEGGSVVDEERIEAEINRSAIINLLEGALVEAVRLGASDIHIFPTESRRTEFHFRLDGRLELWHAEENLHPEAILAVAKDLAGNVDRFERDRAQDGFIQRWVDGALIRYRVSVLPIASAHQEMRAESIVIRVLDDRKVITDLTQLGLLPSALERFQRAISQPYGMVVVTGPTGSGKSTTLVAALHHVIRPELNVLTVEDPVEYIIKGARQIRLSHKLGFEDALRAILRHDPDVVMVGEMRDRQTAELAIKLANTGHLTFATLHTNDAPSAVARLYKMGIEPFLIAYAINLVMAQRLVRVLCPQCKVEDRESPPELLEALGFTEEELRGAVLYKPSSKSSCKRCGGKGYKGRRAIAEALYFSRAIRSLIVQSGGDIDEDAIRRQAISEGMLTLRASARALALQGETSVEEVLRVTADEG